jgi:hypothetical protein
VTQREHDLKRLGSMMERLVAASDATYEKWLKEAGSQPSDSPVSRDDRNEPIDTYHNSDAPPVPGERS